MKRLMFATAGSTPGEVDSLTHSIRQYNPDHVVFLAPEESRTSTVEAVVETLDLVERDTAEEEPNRRWTHEVVDDERLEHTHDVERLHLTCRDAIRDAFERHGGDVENAVADFTRGTKPLSVALFHAAYALDVRIIGYVTGERGDDGHLVQGTEMTYSVYGRRLRALEQLNEAVRLFNDGEYAPAREIAASLAETPDIHLPYEGAARYLVATAADAFEAWDRFRLEEAMASLQALGDDEAVDPSFVGEHLMSSHEREAVRQRHLHRAIHDDMYLGLAADVVANADRRTEQGAYDDAVARLYRALEYLAQLRIYEVYGFETAAFPVDQLPEEMEGLVDDPDRDTCRLSLKQAWDFLICECDALGECFERLLAEHDLEEALRKRNASILAHGFESVDVEYVESLRRSLDRLAATGWGEQDWEEALERCRFPELTGFRE